jgi:recombination protein RecT
MGELAKQEQRALSPMQSLSKFINSDAIKDKFTEILGKKGTPFIASVLSVVSSNKSLQNADKNSIYTAALMAATLDLPINQNLGFAYIVPYNESYNENGQWLKRQVAQFQMGYKGFIQLAQRSGQYKIINSSDVREGEITNHDRMTGEIQFNWTQDATERLSNPVIGYLSYFELNNGFRHTLYMTAEEVEAHAKEYSQVYKSKGKGLWKDKFDAMALKTVTKLNLSKNGPLSIELKQAMLSDQAVIKSDAFTNDPETLDIEPEYIDNQKSEETKFEVIDDKKLSLKIKKANTVEELEEIKKTLADEDFDNLVLIDDKIKTIKADSKGKSTQSEMKLP